MDNVEQLLESLDLHTIDKSRFLGSTRKHHDSAQRVFGGHVLAQGLRATINTLPEGRLPHSLHAYFIRPGDFSSDIEYEVIPHRDGGAFSTRSVIARQGGNTILEMMTSSAPQLSDHVYSAPIPASPGPEELLSTQLQLASYKDELNGWWVRDRPFEFRYASEHPRIRVDNRPPEGTFTAADEDSRNIIWVRAKGETPDDAATQLCLVTYLSDNSILDSVILNNAHAVRSGNGGVASLDHSIWFHSPLNVSEWFRYDTDSPGGSQKRGLAIGHIYSADGTLACTVAQEGLLRAKPPAFG